NHAKGTAAPWIDGLMPSSIIGKICLYSNSGISNKNRKMIKMKISGEKNWELLPITSTPLRTAIAQTTTRAVIITIIGVSFKKYPLFFRGFGQQCLYYIG